VVKLYHELDNHVLVPRHYLPLTDATHEWVGPEDFRLIEGKCYIQPRDQLQEDCLDFLGTYGSNPAASDKIVSLRCGEGKTFIAIKYAFDYGYSLLILSHTKDILLNWRDVILAETSVTDIGSVISGSFDLKPITLGLIQSIVALPIDRIERMSEYFGHIVFDEMHHLAAEVFSMAGNAFPGMRTGLSATQAREDGLSFVFEHSLGTNVFWRRSNRTKAKVVFRRIGQITDVDLPSNYAQSVTKLAESNQYMSALESDIREGYRSLEKQLIVSSRKAVLYELANRLKDIGAVVNTSETDPYDRQINLKTRPIVMSIDRFATEGLDEPTLTTIRVVTPVKDRNAIVQTVGRLERGEGDSINAWFYAPMIGRFLGTLDKAKESLTRSGYLVTEGMDLWIN
jgi:superfamily II DNA or RNA helicase